MKLFNKKTSSANSAEAENTGAKKKNSPKKNAILYLICVLVVAAVLATSGILLSNDLFALAKSDEEITITIPEDASVGQVSRLLDRSGVINYSSFFHLFTSIVYNDVQFRSGMWTLNSNMDYREILSEIRLTSKSTQTVTIPEGYTIEQIIDVLVDNGLSTTDELTSQLQDGEFNYDFLPEDLGNDTNRLEGYLFPDTYEFYLSDSADTIINKMLGNFKNKLDDDTDGESLRQLCEDQDMSVSDMVNIAAMVQKEAVNSEDMKMVSGVIHNRLDNAAAYPYLNIDATIQYAVGHLELTDEDMRSDNPYNTYTYRGLPPGPICNPGYDAMMATVSPSEHDYYYYVANADASSHIYARTQEEQTANIRRVQEEKDSQ